MARKGVLVWVFSSLTFISLVHLIDAISAAVFGGEVRLLGLYPFIGERLETLAPATYFWVAVGATFILWGVTCAVAFESPVEAFLNGILSDAKKQGVAESKVVEEKGEILDVMNESIEANSEYLAQVRDVVYSVRAEVKELEPLRESVEKMRAELGGLRKEFKKVEEKALFTNVCPACAKPLLPEFKMCPYCGEQAKLQSQAGISLKDYK